MAYSNDILVTPQVSHLFFCLSLLRSDPILLAKDGVQLALDPVDQAPEPVAARVQPFT
jgi:hypothetical protein